ncbi:MAG: DegT/DnrJ/EryC1/StrS family aminotransferase [Proteobacteria bacterium]|nr:DegT/DnrJ/EryC1/StrS family aminotransferase [Pseudomonadota bacterium]
MACTDGALLYRRLEDDFNVARAIPVARAALGLMTVLGVWIEAGHAPRVALCANVCHDVVAAVLGASCTPVFLDIDPVTGMVPDQEWARARAAGASVALVVHLYGNSADVSAARAYFPAPECLVIDDAAQALGATCTTGPAGGQGGVGLLSFGATKHIATGGAAVLFKSLRFANAVAGKLASAGILPEAQRQAIHARFRLRLGQAREALRNEGEVAATAFAGLLDGYHSSLYLPFPEGAAQATCSALDVWPQARALRLQKAAAWAAGLDGSPLHPVGMQTGSVPWRYTCRLPGLNWSGQHHLGDAMRKKGLDVSHWYLPAHWMCGHGPGSLPGVEQLAREVFQFWLDEGTSLETIERDAPLACALASDARPS